MTRFLTTLIERQQDEAIKDEAIKEVMAVITRLLKDEDIPKLCRPAEDGVEVYFEQDGKKRPWNRVDNLRSFLAGSDADRKETLLQEWSDWSRRYGHRLRKG